MFLSSLLQGASEAGGAWGCVGAGGWTAGGPEEAQGALEVRGGQEGSGVGGVVTVAEASGGAGGWIEGGSGGPAEGVLPWTPWGGGAAEEWAPQARWT